VSSTSSLDELVRYLRQRITGHVALLVPLLVGASLLAAACAACLTCWAASRWPAHWCLQFRLWDDLADGFATASTTPTESCRGSGRSWSSTPRWPPSYCSTCWAVGLARQPAALLVLLGLDAASLVWYGLLRSHVPAHVVQTLVILLKYPIFVYLLAARSEVFAIPP